MNAIVDRWISDHKDEIVKALQESVRIPSVEGTAEAGAPFGANVKRALDHALELGKGFGFETRDMDGYIGLIDHGEGEETLGIMCHLDVVPEGEGWDHPPYGAEIVDGNIVGRGTMDDKGPAISAIYALAAVKAAGLKMRRKVRIMLGCDEESGWGCMSHYYEHEKMPDMAFSPDADYPVVNSEKGIVHATFIRRFSSKLRLDAGTRPNVVCGKAVASVMLNEARVLPIVNEFRAESGFECSCEPCGDGVRIEIIGLNAHASMPESGNNALQAMFDVLNRLGLEGEDGKLIEAIHKLLRMDMHGESLGLDLTDASGRMTLNPGVMHWDENGLAEFAIDMRVPSSRKAEDALNTVVKAFAPIGLELSGSSIQPGHYVSPDSELVSKLLHVYAQRSGEYLPPLAIGGGTYARAVENAVAFGCERPGVPALVHMPNESISIDDMMFNTCMIADAIIALACVE